MASRALDRVVFGAHGKDNDSLISLLCVCAYYGRSFTLKVM